MQIITSRPFVSHVNAFLPFVLLKGVIKCYNKKNGSAKFGYSL